MKRVILTLAILTLVLSATAAYAANAATYADVVGPLDWKVVNRVSRFLWWQPPRPPYKFQKELRDLRSAYTELVKGIKDKYAEEAKEIKTELDALKAEKQEAIDAVKEAFKERKQELEAELSKLKTEQTEKLTAARKEFIEKIKQAIKEGKWSDIIAAVKEYIAERADIKAEYMAKIQEIEKKLAGLDDEQKKAIAAIEEEFKTKIKELEDELAGLDEEKKQAIDELRKAAEEEVRALCEKYGIPYRKYYVDYVMGNKYFGYGYLLAEKDGIAEVADPNAGATIGISLNEDNDIGQMNNQGQKPIRFVPHMGGSSNEILPIPKD